MKFEHFALNVPDPVALAKWYVKNCNMRIVRSMDAPPHTHFLADERGQTVMEVYHNPKAPVPDYGSQPPLCFHFAFAVSDPSAARARLTAAGAVCADEQTLDDGSRVLMFRDPWGLALQIVCRTKPL